MRAPDAEVHPALKAVLTFLLGEFWCRGGRGGRYCSVRRMPAEITDSGAQQWIIKATRRMDSNAVQAVAITSA